MTDEKAFNPTQGMNSEAKSIHASFDECGITFSDRAEAIAEFGRAITFDPETGNAEADYDGERLPLSECLKRFAFDRRDLVDGRTLPPNGLGNTRQAPMSKESFNSPSEKVAFINEFGLQAWTALPTKAPASREVVTKEDWRTLSVQEKSRRLRANPRAYDELPSAPKVPSSFAKVNWDLIQKQRVGSGSR